MYWLWHFTNIVETRHAETCSRAGKPIAPSHSQVSTVMPACPAGASQVGRNDGGTPSGTPAARDSESGDTCRARFGKRGHLPTCGKQAGALMQVSTVINDGGTHLRDYIEQHGLGST